MTPTWLEAHASYIDSSRASTAQQLTFNAGAVENAALLKVPMIPAGFLKVAAPLTVEITLANDVSIGNITDSDIAYGLSDGSKFIGFSTGDKNNYGDAAPALDLEGCLAQLYPPFSTTHSPQNQATLSTPVSMSSLSSWMNAGARTTLLMTEAS